MSTNGVTLISTKEALKMLPFVTYHGLYKGCKGTSVLTRYPHGLFSKEEIEAFLESLIARGESRTAKLEQRETVAMELV